MGGIANDLLDYLTDNVQKMRKNEDLPHLTRLIPLLTGNQLIQFWNFFRQRDPDISMFLIVIFRGIKQIL